MSEVPEGYPNGSVVEPLTWMGANHLTGTPFVVVNAVDVVDNEKGFILPGCTWRQDAGMQKGGEFVITSEPYMGPPTRATVEIYYGPATT